VEDHRPAVQDRRPGEGQSDEAGELWGIRAARGRHRRPVHISQLSEDRVDKVKDILKIGQDVEARVIKVDRTERRIGLSIKAANYSDEEISERARRSRASSPARTSWGSSRPSRRRRRSSGRRRQTQIRIKKNGRAHLRPPAFPRAYGNHGAGYRAGAGTCKKEPNYGTT